MPRGIKGSGPYSKYKDADADVADLATTKSTPKASSTKATRPKKATAKRTTRRPAKRTTAARHSVTNSTVVINGGGKVQDVGTFHTVTVGADGTLVLEGATTLRAKLRPSALLDLEQDSKVAANAFLASR